MTDISAGPAGLTARAADRFFRTRWMVRMPITLYRAGLGFLFGTRLLMLEHVGRNSGTRRRVVLEVLARPARGEYVIIAGFAQKAQWYRNIRANPHVRVSTGFRRNMPALAVPMTQTESAAVLDACKQRHPAELEQMSRIFQQVCGRPIEAMPMVRLRVAPSP